MARPKGSKNKNSSALPDYAQLSAEGRVEVIANLVVDKILEDLRSGGRILNSLSGKSNA